MDSDLLDENDRKILNKILEDVKANKTDFTKSQKIQIVMVRVLFIWSVRHP